MYDQARALVRDTLPEGPFKGVPFLLKDLIAFFGSARRSQTVGRSPSRRDIAGPSDWKTKGNQ